MLRHPLYTMPFRHFCLRVATLLGSGLIVGCATFTTSPEPEYLSTEDQCVTHLAEEAWLTVDPDHNRAFYRPDAQPWFAIDRLHADFDPADLSEPAFNEWRIRVINHSWQELETHQLQVLGEPMAASRGCLVSVAMATPAIEWQSYAEEARDYDLYRDWQRWVGFYPLTSLVVNQRIRAAQRQWADDYGGPFDQEANLWQPALGDGTGLEAPAGPPEGTTSDWLQEGYAQSELDLPLLTLEQLQVLFQAHAPELSVLQETSADQVGSVGALEGRAVFNTSPVLAYIKPMITRYDSNYLLQLAYTFWFAERPKNTALDIYGGPWNGITWRVTLDTEGQPLWYDNIHNCGCYHQIWLSGDWQPGTELGREAPLFLPLDWEGRPRLTLTPGEHYVRQVVGATDGHNIPPTAVTNYEFQPYINLLRLPDSEQTTTVNLFDRDGLIPESARLERFVLWPFGVKSPGAMRRTGTHTIAFVGKRHFDDPALFNGLIQEASEQTAVD